MGLCMSAEQREQAARDAAIQKQIDAERKIQSKTVKLLLLGAGESGKSTLVKQMKIIHGDGYNNEELKSYRPTIADNLVHSMRAVLEAMGALKINLGSQDNRVHVRAILEYTEVGKSGRLEPATSSAIKALWSDTGVQECYGQRNKFQLNDSAAYYFGRIDDIASLDYMPTQQDVLRARIRTTGIIETSFKFKGMVFRMVDVGGQRSERKKWIQCFDDVTAIVFVSALSGYDTKLFEDQETNRVHESLELFEGICNNKFFSNTAMILFLNKTDLFSEKIVKSNLVDYFPTFQGQPGDAEAAKEFILNMFKQKVGNQKKQLYWHFTCATDTENVRHVFDSVSDIIIEKNMERIGIRD